MPGRQEFHLYPDHGGKSWTKNKSSSHSTGGGFRSYNSVLVGLFFP